MTRFIVEVQKDSFEDVGADYILFPGGGELVLYNGEPTLDHGGTLVLAYAPGQWLNVVREEN